MRFALLPKAPLLELPREDALDLLEWLGLGRPEFGAIEVGVLLPLCRRRLWPELRNVDPAKGVAVASHEARPAGTLRMWTASLAAAVSARSGALLHFG